MVESTFNKVAGITVIFDLFCFTVFIVEFDRVFSCIDKIFGQKISTISTISGCVVDGVRSKTWMPPNTTY